ncbi:MAG: HD domain-containing protein [Clostridiales bacterium]|nr:HD domain-containing protein [Clostridiales bacterium]
MLESRLLKLQIALMREIDKYGEMIPDRYASADWEKLHMASSARLAYMMALERGVNPELAACACAVHDYGRIVTGKQPGHAEAGYEPVKSFLKSLGDLFTPEEQEIIALATKNHSKKSVVGTPYDEIVKDADVVDCYQYGIPFERDEQKKRYEEWLKKVAGK